MLIHIAMFENVSFFHKSNILLLHNGLVEIYILKNKVCFLDPKSPIQNDMYAKLMLFV